jgi:hypothetical protein
MHLDQDTLDRRRQVLGEDHPSTLASALIAVCQVAAQLLNRLAGSWSESWHQDRAATRDLVEHIMALDESSNRCPPDSDLDTQVIGLRGWAL